MFQDRYIPKEWKRHKKVLYYFNKDEDKWMTITKVMVADTEDELKSMIENIKPSGYVGKGDVCSKYCDLDYYDNMIY